ncbi:MAG: hypothetical protein R2771_11495, partial [Saprospiraceae bacterium]
MISSQTYYWYENTNTGYASMKIYGDKDSYSSFKNDQYQAERKAAKEKKKGKEEEAKSDNPFLKNVDASVEEVEENTDNLNTSRPLAYVVSLDESYTHSTNKNVSAANSYKEYERDA